MIFQSIILGLIQGLAEFLPISSSGHLVLFKSLFGVETAGALFEAVLHLGTVTAVVIYFNKELLSIGKNQLKALLIATIPVGVIGFLFKDAVESLFTSTTIVGVALLVTAAINWFIDKQDGRKQNVDGIDAVFIGFAQAFAIIPGISRSGSTILAAKSMQIDSKAAAQFSFILSIPAILGANFVEFASHGIPQGEYGILFYVVGFISALASGLFAIDMMIKFLSAKRIKLFAVYCLIVGIATLVL